jgi:hypothetical protein
MKIGGIGVGVGVGFACAAARVGAAKSSATQAAQQINNDMNDWRRARSSLDINSPLTFGQARRSGCVAAQIAAASYINRRRGFGEFRLCEGESVGASCGNISVMKI